MKAEGSDVCAVVEGFNQAWQAGDLEGALAHCAPDVVYALHLDENADEHGGCWVGLDEVRTVLSRLRERFEFEVFRPTIMGVSGDTVRQRVEFTGIHKASGERMSLRYRLVFIVRKGKIFQADEFHDAAMLQAFFRLVASKGYAAK